MARNRDRNFVSWAMYLRGSLARERVCSHCASPRVMRSHTPFGSLAQALRLVAMRCRACGKRFALRGGVAGASPATRGASVERG